MTNAYNARDGAVWVQPGGPNSELYFLGCHDVDSISIPLVGGRERVRKFDPSGRGWLTVGQNETPPDNGSVTITGLLFKQRDWLEKLNCPFNLYIMMRSCGPANVFDNYERGFVYPNALGLTRTREGLAMREEETSSTVGLEISLEEEVSIVDVVVDRLTTAAVLAANGLWTNPDGWCYGDCGDSLDPGELVAWGLDSAAGPATADLFRSTNFGVTNAATATDPLSADIDIMAVAQFLINASVRRIVVAGGEAAGQAEVAFSDDNGATWTVVNIGGAAANHSPTKGSGLFVLDQYNMWLATEGGYIYKSEDGGETWTAYESGAITTDPYHAIHFSDEHNGVAVSDSDVIVVSSDGGETWAAVTATGGGNNILSCFRLDENRVWVGDDGGQLWYSDDNGTTWTEKTGQGFAAGDINDIVFANEIVGYLINDTAGPVGSVWRTNNGGYSWVQLSTPTNAGLNDLAVADETLAYAAGEASGGTAVVLKVHATD